MEDEMRRVHYAADVPPVFARVTQTTPPNTKLPSSLPEREHRLLTSTQKGDVRNESHSQRPLIPST